MEPKVTIVLVNYNAQSYMKAFFDSVWEQDYRNLDVILVDNASNDASVEWLKDKQKNVCLLELEENVGFGEGCNIGMREAIAQNAEYVLLLNIDTVLKPNLVTELVKYADANTVTTATIYCGENENDLRLWYAGGNIDYETSNVSQVLQEKPEKSYYNVKFISGCCMLLHKEVIRKVGYFHKEYYLYYEDTDYCTRMEKALVNMRYVTTTSLWHKVGGSSVGGSEMSCSTQYYVTRNRLLFAERNAEKFEKGNLSVLREILKERAFFDGKKNEKYKLYIQCAIADFMKEYYGKGYYGDTLINDRYCMEEGFYEREANATNVWYWANSGSAKFYITNPKRENVVYNISFDLVLPQTAQRAGVIEVMIEGESIGKYQLPCHVEFPQYVKYESKCVVDLIFEGEIVEDIKDNNERNLCYQLVNLKVEDTGKEYYLEEGFYPTEGEDSKWNWSSSNKGVLCLVNKKNHSQLRQIDMIIESYAKGTEYNVILRKDGEIMFSGKLPCAISLLSALDKNQKSEISIETDAPVEMDGEREVCFKIRDLDFENIFDEIYWGNSFLPEEIDKENSWHWCSMHNGTIYITNNAKCEKIECISFEVDAFICNENLENEVVIFENGKQAVCLEDGKKRKIFLQIEPYSVSVIDIKTKFTVGTEKNNGRSLGFKVSNFNCEDIIGKEIYMGAGFYPQETDGVNVWNWVYKQSAEILFVCTQVERSRASFVLQCDSAFSDEKVSIFLDNILLGEYEYEKPIIIETDNAHTKCHKLRITVEHQPYSVAGDDRQFTFQIVDFMVQDINRD